MLPLRNARKQRTADNKFFKERACCIRSERGRKRMLRHGGREGFGGVGMGLGRGVGMWLGRSGTLALLTQV